MIKVISLNQPGVYGPMDILYDTSDNTVMVAVDIRDYTGTINPQYTNSAVLVTFPDDLPWLFGAEVVNESWSYVRPFNSYADYCSWLNRNNLELS